jgi:hypothetical protein
MSYYSLSHFVPVLAFLVLAIVILYFQHVSVTAERDAAARRDAQKRDDDLHKANVDWALRGATLDLARLKAAQPMLGFAETRVLAKLVPTPVVTAPVVSAPVVAAVATTPVAAVAAVPSVPPVPAPPVASTPVVAAVAPVSVGNQAIDVPEVSAVFPSRVLTREVCEEAFVVMGYYPDFDRSICTLVLTGGLATQSGWTEYELGASRAGTSDEQAMSDALELAGPTLMAILSDPQTEHALRVYR